MCSVRLCPPVRIAHDKEEEEVQHVQTTPVWNYVLGGIAGVLLIVCIALAAKKAKRKKIEGAMFIFFTIQNFQNWKGCARGFMLRGFMRCFMWRFHAEVSCEVSLSEVSCGGFVCILIDIKHIRRL